MAVFTAARAAVHTGLRAGVVVAAGYGAYLAGGAALASGVGAPVAMAAFAGLAIASGSISLSAARPFIDKAGYLVRRTAMFATKPFRRRRRRPTVAAANATVPASYTPPAPFNSWAPWTAPAPAGAKR